eukprot:scaffold206890_cov32-Tisochrysis_lutea.AAC.2
MGRRLVPSPSSSNFPPSSVRLSSMSHHSSQHQHSTSCSAFGMSSVLSAHRPSLDLVPGPRAPCQTGGRLFQEQEPRAAALRPPALALEIGNRLDNRSGRLWTIDHFLMVMADG